MPSHTKAAKAKTKGPVGIKKPTRVSTRKKIPPFLLWFALTGGRKTAMGYSSLKPHGGGGTGAWTHLRVRDFVDKDSDAVSSLPPAIASARAKYPGCSFKAGHLINATFGGPGNDSKNLTILSASGNSQHKNFDNKVKEALRQLKKSYVQLWKLGLPPDEAVLTIEVIVRTEGEWDVMLPDSVICTNLRCTANLTGMAKVNGYIANLGAAADPKLVAEYRSFVSRAQTLINQAANSIPNPR